MVKLMLITNQMKVMTMKQGLNMMMTHQMKVMTMRQCLGEKIKFTSDFVKGLGFCNGIIPFLRQPHHTLKETIEAQVISL
jgi:hypothetical protein